MKKLLIIIILSSLITIIPVSLYRASHMFVIGLNPFPGFALVFVVLIIAVPVFIFLFRRLSRFLKNKISFTPDVLFAMGFFSFLISGFIIRNFDEQSSLDIHLHDTYFVVGSSVIIFLIEFVFAIFSATYHWFPKIFRRQMNALAGYIHFVITLFGAYLVFWPMHYEGLAGMPRRYLDYSGWSLFDQFRNLNIFITNGVIIILAAQALFLFNFCYSIFKGKRINTSVL